MAGTLQNQLKTKLNDNRLSSPPFSTGVEMGLVLSSFSGWGDPTVGNGIIPSDEPVFAGYARQSVSGWGASVLTADGHAKSAAAAVGFSNSSGAPHDVAGWFLYDTTAGLVLMIGQFPATLTIPDGETLPVAPYWTDTGE